MEVAAVGVAVAFGVAALIDRARHPGRYAWTETPREVRRRLGMLAGLLGVAAVVGLVSGAPVIAGLAAALWICAAAFALWLLI